MLFLTRNDVGWSPTEWKPEGIRVTGAVVVLGVFLADESLLALEAK
jgi:hypothetical protein